MLTERLATVMVDSGSVLSLELIEQLGRKLFIQSLRYSPRYSPTRRGHNEYKSIQLSFAFYLGI